MSGRERSSIDSHSITNRLHDQVACQEALCYLSILYKFIAVSDLDRIKTTFCCSFAICNAQSTHHDDDDVDNEEKRPFAIFTQRRSIILFHVALEVSL